MGKMAPPFDEKLTIPSARHSRNLFSNLRYLLKSLMGALNPDLLWKIRRQSYLKNPRAFWARVGESAGYENPGPIVSEAQGKFIAENIKPLGPGSVLEIGCGWGRILSVVRRHMGEGVSVVGLDFGHPQLTLAKRNDPTSRLIEGNAVCLPFKDNSFDVVYTMGVFMHIPPDQIASAYTEAIRVSRKYIVHGEDLSGAYHRFSYDHEKEYQKRGFHIKVSEAPPLLHVDPKKKPQFLIVEKITR